MGSLYLYRCASCQYQVQVGGDYDRGFSLYRVTIECWDCQELMDVDLESEVWRENCQGNRLTNPVVKCNFDSEHTCETWRGSCPKCGEPMTTRELVMDWD